jgi:glutamate racemase
MKIGVFDSGIGGLTTTAEIYKRLPNADYIYYADNKNAFFGDKTRFELISISEKAVDFFAAEKVDIIVFACNTATAAAIDYLRTKSAVPIVGVEPAVKPALEAGGTTAVLATPFTASSERLFSLNKNGLATVIPASGLAELIERDFCRSHGRISDFLMNLLGDYSFDNLVLGCTHYCFISGLLKHLLPHCKLFDSNIGVAKRVEFLAGNDHCGNGEIQFYFTAEQDEISYKTLFENIQKTQPSTNF